MNKNTLENKHKFSAKIYQIGINWCVDVPKEITDSLIKDRGKINVLGKINSFEFKKTLMPVKNSFHRLFVNKKMLVGGETKLGEFATFEIRQDYNKEIKNYPIPKLLKIHLDKNNLNEKFKSITPSKKRAILKYLSFIKTEKTMMRNISKITSQLLNNIKDIKVP